MAIGHVKEEGRKNDTNFINKNNYSLGLKCVDFVQCRSAKLNSHCPFMSCHYELTVSIGIVSGLELKLGEM